MSAEKELKIYVTYIYIYIYTYVLARLGARTFLAIIQIIYRVFPE